MDKLQAQIEDLLAKIISDGFNRSVGALVSADDSVMREHYTGVGSKYYDMVSKEIEYTAKYGAKSIVDTLENQ